MPSNKKALSSLLSVLNVEWLCESFSSGMLPCRFSMTVEASSAVMKSSCNNISTNTSDIPKIDS